MRWNRWLLWLSGVGLMWCGPTARAQVTDVTGGSVMGGLGAAPAAPVAGAAGAAPAAAAPTRNIWSLLIPSMEQKKNCRAKLCTSSLGQFLNALTRPMTAYSGGFVKPLCPPPNAPNPADLAKPPDGPEGAAARIKKSEAEAKARRAAVRYLGTVNCKRYPEAEGALINALRADPNECVRLEAALALGNGCCCTRKTLEALVITASGKKTNDPAETSERVKAVAAYALAHCLGTFHEERPTPERPEAPGPVRPEVPGKEAPPPGAVSQVGPRPGEDILLAEARQVLAGRQVVPPRLEPIPVSTLEPRPAQAALVSQPLPLAEPPPSAPPPEALRGSGPVPPTGKRDVLTLIRYAWRGQ